MSKVKDFTGFKEKKPSTFKERLLQGVGALVTVGGIARIITLPAAIATGAITAPLLPGIAIFGAITIGGAMLFAKASHDIKNKNKVINKNNFVYNNNDITNS